MTMCGDDRVRVKVAHEGSYYWRQRKGLPERTGGEEGGRWLVVGSEAGIRVSLEEYDNCFFSFSLYL